MTKINITPEWCQNMAKLEGDNGDGAVGAGLLAMDLTFPTLNLVEIAARLNAATPGPWDIGGGFDEAFSVWLKDRRPDVLASYIERKADAVFMAHAREDVAAMLAHIHMLSRTVLDQATELHRLRGMAESVVADSDSPTVQDVPARITEAIAAVRIAALKEAASTCKIIREFYQQCLSEYVNAHNFLDGKTIGAFGAAIEVAEDCQMAIRALINDAQVNKQGEQ